MGRTRSTHSSTRSGSTAARSSIRKRPSAAYPNGAFVLVEDQPWIVLDGGLLRWTPAGYRGRRPLPARGLVITPPSLVAVLRVGWEGAVPLLHPSVTQAA